MSDATTSEVIQAVPRVGPAPETLNEQSPPPPANLKRRQSEASEPAQEHNTKRARTDATATTSSPRTEAPRKCSHPSAPVAIKTEPSTDAARRAPKAADEKGRSKRLFGALLGNLNQPGDRTSKKRQEIEARRKAELEREDAARGEEARMRREEAAGRRQATKGKLEEERMRLRHQNMLDRANFLSTRAEPRIFYRPWELLDEEEDQIDDQLKDAQALIDEEVEAHAQRQRPQPEFQDHEQALPDTASTGTATADAAISQQPPDPDPAQAQHDPDATTNIAAVEKDRARAKSATDEIGVDTPLPATAATTTDQPPGESNANGASASHPRDVQVGDAGAGAKETQDEAADDDGGHVVEGGEDTVIY